MKTTTLKVIQVENTLASGKEKNISSNCVVEKILFWLKFAPVYVTNTKERQNRTRAHELKQNGQLSDFYWYNV